MKHIVASQTGLTGAAEDPAAPEPLRGRVRRAGLLGLLVLAVGCGVLAGYWPVLSAEALCFDDSQFLVENELVRSPGSAAVGRSFEEVPQPSTGRGYYQPLAMIWLMVDAAMGGRADDLRVFHQTSLALHVGNTALVVVLMYLLFGEAWVAAGVGLLFGVHPLTIEAVARVAELQTLLATFFVLWCLILYTAYARRGGGKRYAGCLAAYGLALLCKPASVAVPVLLLVLDYWPMRRLGKRAVKEKIPLLLMGGVVAVVIVALADRSGGVETAASPAGWGILLAACQDVVFYLQKVIWPAGLNWYYSMPPQVAVSDPRMLAGLVGTVLLVGALLLSTRWTRSLLGGWLFFLLAVLPTVGVLRLGHVIAADRFMYLPLIGLGLPVAAGLGWLWRAPGGGMGWAIRRIGVLGVVAIPAGAAGLATHHYLGYWQDTETLCRRMVALAPQAPAPVNHLADLLVKQGKTDEAVRLLSELAKARPDLAQVHYNLGNAYLGQGRIEPAIEQYREAVRLDPTDDKACYNLGLAYAQKGELAQAVVQYRQTLRLNPDHVNAHNNLGNALLEQGRIDEAIAQFQEALRLEPALAIARYNLGLAFLREGRTDAAVAEFRIAVSMDPGDARMHNNLGGALFEQGKVDEAVAAFREATRCDPRFAIAYKNLGWALAKQGRGQEAAEAYRGAVAVEPGDVDARCKLADLLRQQGQIDQAIQEYQEVLRIAPQHVEAQKQLPELLAERAGPAQP